MQIAGRTGEAIGLDIGGLRIKVARVRFDQGETTVVGHRVVVRGESELSQDGMIGRLHRLILDIDPDGDLPVGVGVAGIINATDGIVVQSPNYPQWDHFALALELRRRSGRQVFVDNDANTFLLGEWVAGAVRGQSNVLAVTLGTGLGGAILHDGRLVRGQRGMAGEIGHVRFVAQGARCGCGASGCAEQYMSTQFLERIARASHHPAVEGVETVEIGRALATAARNGDSVARALFLEMGDNLGEHLGGMANVLDVKSIVIGGGLASCYDLFGKALEAAIHVFAYDGIASDLVFYCSELGDEAGCVGAAALAVMDGS